MGALTAELREFLDTNRVGVLAMLAPDGKPRQSLVYYAREGDRLLISTLSDRLKARDARRTGWASLYVMGHEPPYPSATFSGPHAGSALRADDRRPKPRLRALTTAVHGEHPSAELAWETAVRGPSHPLQGGHAHAGIRQV